MIILHALALAGIVTISPDYYAVQKLNTSFLKKGVVLNIAGKYKEGGGEPEEAFEYLALTRSGKTKILKRLEELRGSVEIKNSKDALDYVRLQTSPATWYLWKSGASVIEMIDNNHAHSMTNYGVAHPFPAGITSKSAIGEAGISAAIVKSMPHSYQITRWLLVATFKDEEEKRVLRRVQEKVSVDGGYQVRILKEMPVKNWWDIPHFQ